MRAVGVSSGSSRPVVVLLYLHLHLPGIPLPRLHTNASDVDDRSPQKVVQRLEDTGISAVHKLHRDSGMFESCSYSAVVDHSLFLLSQIRSGFRVVELSEGFQGRLATSEAFFYGLDTLPLFIATAVYIPFWPGRFIAASGSVMPEKEAHELSGSGITQ